MTGWADELMPMRFVEGDVEPSLYRWVRDLRADCSATAVGEQGEFIRTQDLTQELRQIRAPILILAPDGSPFVDRSMPTDLHALIATSELQWFPGQRHSLLMSRARECAAAYVDFLKRRTWPHVVATRRRYVANHRPLDNFLTPRSHDGFPLDQMDRNAAAIDVGVNSPSQVQTVTTTWCDTVQIDWRKCHKANVENQSSFLIRKGRQFNSVWQHYFFLIIQDF